MPNSRNHHALSVVACALAVSIAPLPLFAKSTTNTNSVSACRHDDTNFRCVQWVKNYDGDTITVNIPRVHVVFGNKIKIRVKGIDTPEIRTKNSCEKKKGQAGQQFVERLCSKARRIDLTNVAGKDNFGRLLADVVCDGKSVAAELLKKQLAYRYDGKKKPNNLDWCKPLSPHLLK
ncbi:MAG: thermonuclease family protein [Pseudomonadota bacterium]|nr:thermonuclease family protein [Pseudomonadota bacterium]